MGVSRSASTVIAYAMKQYNWGLKQAHAYVKKRRPIIKPNEGFKEQLIVYEGILRAKRQSGSWGQRLKERKALPRPWTAYPDKGISNLEEVIPISPPESPTGSPPGSPPMPGLYLRGENQPIRNVINQAREEFTLEASRIAKELGSRSNSIESTASDHTVAVASNQLEQTECITIKRTESCESAATIKCPGRSEFNINITEETEMEVTEQSQVASLKTPNGRPKSLELKKLPHMRIDTRDRSHSHGGITTTMTTTRAKSHKESKRTETDRKQTSDSKGTTETDNPDFAAISSVKPTIAQKPPELRARSQGASPVPRQHSNTSLSSPLHTAPVLEQILSRLNSLEKQMELLLRVTNAEDHPKKEPDASEPHRTPDRDDAFSSSFLTSEITAWDTAQVCAWLRRGNLGQYCDIFTANGITGADLKDLTNNDLASCGIIRLTDRKAVLRQVATLF